MKVVYLTGLEQTVPTIRTSNNNDNAKSQHSFSPLHARATMNFCVSKNTRLTQTIKQKHRWNIIRRKPSKASHCILSTSSPPIKPVIGYQLTSPGLRLDYQPFSSRVQPSPSLPNHPRAEKQTESLSSLFPVPSCSAPKYSYPALPFLLSPCFLSAVPWRTF
ncbi:hypothetical protein BDV97DRAFT_125358 [Delphinella strobiligena]|nr:hypothetical protein BDV97DRAFT_125358 [Delphinella strobiligena]